MSVVVTHIVGRVYKSLGRRGVESGLMKAGDVIKVLEWVCGQLADRYLQVRDVSKYDNSKEGFKKVAVSKQCLDFLVI